jgi:hypothetical protein
MDVMGTDNAAGFVRRLQAKAKSSVTALKAEYEAGRRGDDSEPQPIWAGPREQLDAVLAALTGASALRGSPSVDADPVTGDGVEANPDVPESVDPAEAGLVDAVGRVDWTAVRTATAERSADAAATVKEMAARVDWERMQPAAAQVSRALIAAVAAGRLPVAGPLGGQVARAIVNHGDLAKRLAGDLHRAATPVPVDVFPTGSSPIIDVTSRETTTGDVND